MRGMNTIRLPLSWGYLQLGGVGLGQINLGYYDNYIRHLLQTLTHAHVYTILDLVNEPVDVPDDKVFTIQAAWSSGHGWGDYNLRVKPQSYQMDVLKDFLNLLH